MGVGPGNEERTGLVVDGVAIDDDAERFGPRAHHVENLRMQLCGERHLRPFPVVKPPGYADGLGDGGRLVEQGGGCDRQAGKLGDQRLEVEQHLQATLAYLGLVGRIGGVPGRIFEQIALDDRRHHGAVIAGADKALQHDVGAHLGSKLGQRLCLGRRRRQGERAVEADRLRHGLADQRLD